MTTTTQPQTTAPTTTRRGFPGIHCPLCGTADEVQRLDLDDLETITCGGCDESYTLDNIRERIAGWQKVIAWVEMAPILADNE